MTIITTVFFLWALYKMSRVLGRFWTWLQQKLAARRFEQQFISELAFQIKMDREG